MKEVLGDLSPVLLRDNLKQNQNSLISKRLRATVSTNLGTEEKTRMREALPLPLSDFAGSREIDGDEETAAADE